VHFVYALVGAVGMTFHQAEECKRVEPLTQELRTDVPIRRRITVEDAVRLRALSYLD
jgi:hypothetical protein